VKWLRFILALACFAAGSAARAAIPSDALLNRLQPQRDTSGGIFFVNDFANLLNPSQRDALERRVRDLQQKTSAELAVVTIKTLEGGQIDDFTNKLFRRWGVGQKGKNNGVMLLVALDDRKMRIEVGYGLEPIIPDALAGRIIDEELRPLFRQGNFPEGIKRGVERIAAIIERGEPPSRLDAVKAKIFSSPTDAPLEVQIIGTLFISVFVIFGAFMVGEGAGSKQGGLLVFGLIFSGFPMFMALMLSGLAPVVLLAIWIVVFRLAFRDGRKNTASYRAGRRRGYRNRKTYNWTWAGSGGGGDSGWSSGGLSGGDSGGGGFGGGDSGGGGASGGW